MMEPEGTLSKFPYKGPKWAPFLRATLAEGRSPCGAHPLNCLPQEKHIEQKHMHGRRSEPNSLEKLICTSWVPLERRRRANAHLWEGPRSQTWPAEDWGPGLCLLLSAHLLQGRSLLASSVSWSDQPGSNSMRLQSLHASASFCFTSLVSLSFSSSLPSWNNLTSGCWTCPSKGLWAPLDAKFACSGRRCGMLFCLVMVAWC